jgi:hypothetical protein
VVLCGLGLTAVAGCADAADPATAPSSTSSTTTPSTTTSTSTTTAAPPTTAATTTPLSRFEGKASVVALRAWAVAAARSITAGDAAMKAVVPHATANGLSDTRYASADDMGLLYPGPLPFTPVKVTESGSAATVLACLQSGGWGQDPKTKLPKSKRAVIAADFTLKKVAGRWKVNSFVGSTRSCSKVTVKGVAS